MSGGAAEPGCRFAALQTCYLSQFFCIFTLLVIRVDLVHIFGNLAQKKQRNKVKLENLPGFWAGDGELVNWYVVWCTEDRDAFTLSIETLKGILHSKTSCVY